MLDKHEVGLFLLRHEVAEALLEFHFCSRVVLGERGICHHDIEKAKLTFIDELGMNQRVLTLDPGLLDAMKDHVHLTHLVRVRTQLLSVQGQFPGGAVARFDIVPHIDEKTSGADGRIADLRILRGLEDSSHQFDDRSRRIELAALLTGIFRKILQQIFVRGTEQIGELEILVSQGDSIELVDETRQNIIPRTA